MSSLIIAGEERPLRSVVSFQIIAGEERRVFSDYCERGASCLL